MAALNRRAAEIISPFRVNACTDVTGFGLLGHLAEMVCGSGLSVRLFAARVPVIARALAFAEMGLIPAGAYKNREFRGSMIVFAEPVARARQDILLDPQTSGGLLIGVDGGQADQLVAALKAGGVVDASPIAEVLDDAREKIWVL